MTREAALLVMVAAAIVLVALMAWGWWRRARRDAHLALPADELPADSSVRAVFDALYVATTVHDRPLERLAVRGLGFRSAVTITITDAGVLVDLPSRPVLLTPARLVAVDQSTVAIDRVVESDGLTLVTWRIDGSTVVDSYFRPLDASARALADAIRPLVPAASPTGDA